MEDSTRASTNAAFCALSSSAISIRMSAPSVSVRETASTQHDLSARSPVASDHGPDAVTKAVGVGEEEGPSKRTTTMPDGCLRPRAG